MKHILQDTISEQEKTNKIITQALNDGYKWENVHGVIAKIKEEISELEEAILANDREEIEAEFGDLAWTVSILQNYLNYPLEKALERTNIKFVNRYEFMKENLKNANVSFENATLDQMLEGWKAAKIEEKRKG